MRAAPIRAVVGLSLASLASVTTAFPLCALDCFDYLMTTYPPLTCTEENMFLCFCKSTFLALSYRDCACANCTAADAPEAIQYGLDVCGAYNAPINWLPTTCPK
ncbi:hypothetical protein QBC33DRAFT_562229 [Phialemonium atrogriseum]|uniref:CFEM domain-containing protein n=1 Tax=Phialemonium atrogriseum TaxID=1093897 RepID=A0AAJ0BY28_9PEZI|nr:uncharacterized protein QBC33DRAFT_562229 [Phialemonium atrogriseum]KAK1764181.1 hypothetical protein QBC33DRAFT_562229 [Phialemonium atrogriseum]